MIIYEPKSIYWISTNPCNSNNHRYVFDEEYCNSCDLTNKDKWVNIFPDNSIIFPLSSTDCRLIRDAAKIGLFTLKRPELYSEELYDLETRIKNILPNDITVFIRINAHSPKDGCYLTGPLHDAEMIVNSLVTSRHIYKSISSKNTDNLYINPWREDFIAYGDYEYRVFVDNRKVTAISQYKWMYEVDHSNIILHTNLIINYIDTNVIPKVNWIESYVVDVIVINNEYVDFIELGPFGSDQASGSCCFHWINDCNKLYDGINIYVRYVPLP